MISRYQKELASYIALYLYYLEQLRLLNQYIYNRTELFERGYENNYWDELHNYFAKKLTLYARYITDLFDTMNEVPFEYKEINNKVYKRRKKFKPTKVKEKVNQEEIEKELGLAYENKEFVKEVLKFNPFKKKEVFYIRRKK